MTAPITTSPVTLDRQEFTGRLHRVRELMHDHGVEVAIAYGNSYLPGDVQYLTGYDPQLESAAVLVLPDDVLAIGGPEGEAMFADQAVLGSWRNLDSFKIPGQQYDGLRFWTLQEIFAEELARVPQRVGALSAPGTLTWETVQHVRSTGSELVDASPILRELCYRKTSAELAMFRTASAIATAAMQAMLDAVQPGVTELTVAAAGDAAIKRLGAYAAGFDTIVCAGPRINTIIGRATKRTIGEGELVMLGVSPRYEGYCSALGRTVVAGAPTRAQRAFLDHGVRAFELATEAFGVDRPAHGVDLAAREYLTRHGLSRYHTYGVGHGIGLSECLEDRTATAVSDYNLPPGIAMMLDVGLFGHPEFVGSRHEDPFVIDHHGRAEHLTDLPMAVH